MKAQAVAMRRERTRDEVISVDETTMTDADIIALLGDGALVEPCGGFCEPTGEGLAMEEESPLLRRFGRTGEYALRLALTEEDRLACWHLVYQEYLALGYTPVLEEPYRYSIHDALPGTITLLAEKDGVAVGTVSGIPDSPLGLPADAIYRDELDAMRARGRRLLEVGRLTIAREYANDRQILTNLFDALTIYTRRICQATDMVITVNPSHCRYYEGMLLFRKIGVDKALESVCGAPAVLLALDMDLEERIRRYATGEGPKPEEYAGGRSLYRYASNRAQENECVEQLVQLFRKPELHFLNKYFVWKRPLLQELSEHGQKMFESWYPGLETDWAVPAAEAV